jgi:glycerophosphoryl diester phosphodiesterase
MQFSLPSLMILLATAASSAPLIVAHRGASHDAPENTLPAFKLAWQQGADAIEGDFQLTRDGRIVCIHDPDTKRVTGIKRVVKDSTLDELRALDAGAWFKPAWKGTRLPTFSEVAATVPAGRKFYIEVKCGAEILPALLRDLAASGLTADQVVVISFKAPVIRELKKQAPQFTAYWLTSFDKQSPLNPTAAAVVATLGEIKADGFSSSADARMDETYIKTIRAAGFDYHCWTVDDPQVAKRFDRLGARSITTNRPEFLRNAVR